MATQATLAALRRKKRRTRTEATSAPAWYPFQASGGRVDAEESVTRIQAAFRGHRARIYSQRVFKKAVVSKTGLQRVAKEIKQFHIGWRHLLMHVLLLVFLTAVIWLQTVHFQPRSSSAEFALQRAIERVEFGDDSYSYEMVDTLDDVLEFTIAMIKQMYSPDPYLNRSAFPEACSQVPACSEIDTDALLNQCASVTEFGGFLDQFNRQQFGLGIIQKRWKQTRCKSKIEDLYSSFGFYLPEFEDVKCVDEGAPFAKEFQSIYFRLHPEEFDPLDSLYQFDENANGFVIVSDMGILNLNVDIVECILRESMQNKRWLDEATHEVCLILVTQNRNGVGLYAYFRLCFTSDLGGSFDVKLAVESGKILHRSEQYAVIALTALYAMQTFLNIVVFLHDGLKGLGRTWRCAKIRRSRRYGVWHFVFEGFILSLHVVGIALYSSYVVACRDFNPFMEYTSFELTEGLAEIVDLINLASTTRTVYAFLLLLMAIRTIMMLDFHSDTAIISRTLTGAASELFSFSVVFVVVVVSYAFIGVLLFSADGFAFQNIPNAIITLLFVSMGEFGAAMDVIFNRFLDSSGALISQLYFWSFTFFTTLILFNILLSIVIESFVQFQENKEFERGVPFLQSALLSWQIASYDVKHFYVPHLGRFFSRYFSCKRTRDRISKTSIPLNPTTKEGAKDAEANLAEGRGEEQQEFELFEENENYNSLLARPHRYLERLAFVRANSKFTIPTFVVRREFEAVFSSSLTERLLWLLRERTAQAQKLPGEEEVGIFFRASQTQLYLVERINVAISMLKAQESNTTNEKKPVAEA